jgi:hypothetical protein
LFLGAAKLQKNDHLNGNNLLIHADYEGVDKKGQPQIWYRGFIDYTKEKGKYILIQTRNNVKQSGETVATFDDSTVANVGRSFAIIQTKMVNERSANAER